MPSVKSITQTTLRNIEPTGQIQYIRDDSLRGFGIKVTARGKASFFVEKRVRGGRTVRQLIGDIELISLSDAKLEAQTLLYRLSRGEDVARSAKIEAAPLNSLAKTLDTYIVMRTATKMKASTAHKYRQQISYLFSDWLTIPVNAISMSMVEERYQKLRKANKSENYVNSAFRTLKAILNSASIIPNPVDQAMKHWSISLASTAKCTFLRSDEIKQLIDNYILGTLFIDAKAPQLEAFLLFILLTGCRKSEALNLTWADVTTKEITFRNTKNHLDHTVPNFGMISDVLNVCRHETNSSSERVFALTEDKLKKRLKAQREAGKLGNWTTHDLRRTFAEHSQLAGFYPHQIALALNHSPTDITRKSYLSGKLAKLSQLRNMYEVYQSQLLSYFHGGIDDAKVSPQYLGSRLDGVFEKSIMDIFPNYYRHHLGEEFMTQLDQS
ncbi:MAG: tyrosine-type recombinase/integrase [Marivivens sp.]|uniref:integrase family protein n=1 Tax=Marivivens sp. TaxID=1978374 RepID=UPI00179A0B7C|nr:integrase family protein [Marivivens sp.]NVJ95662.1 tyrosine-type recombinase/integrase [Marivivens sp.]